MKMAWMLAIYSAAAERHQYDVLSHTPAGTALLVLFAFALIFLLLFRKR
jgi:hypothetical protein